VTPYQIPGCARAGRLLNKIETIVTALKTVARRARNFLRGGQPPAGPPVSDALLQAVTAWNPQWKRPVYLDVGSNGGIPPEWAWLVSEGRVSAVLVDMVDEWRQIPQSLRGDVKFVRAAAGATDGDAVAYLTKHPACSSCRRPNAEVLKPYPVRSWFDVVKEVPVTLRRLDSLVKEHALEAPEIVKIDAQALEYEILEGLGALLQQVQCIECECHLREVYSGQKTFPELYSFLTSQGFILRDLSPQGPFEHEALELNSFWSRPPTKADPREACLIRIWEAASEIWPGMRFTPEMDATARAKHRFNA
jgi:FkbM family methyltransferase